MKITLCHTPAPITGMAGGESFTVSEIFCNGKKLYKLRSKKATYRSMFLMAGAMYQKKNEIVEIDNLRIAMLRGEDNNYVIVSFEPGEKWTYGGAQIDFPPSAKILARWDGYKKLEMC